MKNYNLWYDNGTGWFEGPYPAQGKDIFEAADSVDLGWCFRMGYAVIDSKTDPN